MTSSSEIKRILVYGVTGLKKRCLTTIESTSKIQVLSVSSFPKVPWERTADTFLAAKFQEALEHPDAFHFTDDLHFLCSKGSVSVPVSGPDIMRAIFEEMVSNEERSVYYSILLMRFEQKLMKTLLSEPDRLSMFKSFVNMDNIPNTLSCQDFFDFAAVTMGFTGCSIRNVFTAVKNLHNSRLLEMKESTYTEGIQEKLITRKDLLDLIANPPPSVSQNWEDVDCTRPFSDPMPLYRSLEPLQNIPSLLKERGQRI